MGALTFEDYLLEQERPLPEAVEFVAWLVERGEDLMRLQGDADGGLAYLRGVYDEWSRHRLGLRSRGVRDEAAARLRELGGPSAIDSKNNTP